ncbi:ornithine cyclodeaminase family protein [Ancylomarina salipaludis]|nr:ornithine cyclodeaminase family protein [Ancylomarina salipaludis]
MLILNQREIWSALSFEEALSAMEEAFLLFEAGDFHMPDRMHAHHGDNTLLLMPCFTNQYFGTKLVSVNPENPKRNLPAIYGSMILNDTTSGEALSLMNGAALTAFRTGAVGGIGIKYTTPVNANSVGIIGTGVQGFTQALFACKVRPIKELYVFDTQQKKANEFIAKLKMELPHLKLQSCSSNIELVNKSQIIITTTTSKKAVVPDDAELIKGKHFIGIGSYKPDMHEFPAQLYPLLDKLYVDTPFAKEETGDVATALKNGLISDSQVTPISKLIASKKTIAETTSLFKSVGMALFDLVMAQKIYARAMESKIGSEIEI